MNTELKIKVMNDVAPVTLADAVYMGDGTNTTVADKIKTLSQNSGTPSGNTSLPIRLVGGDVCFDVHASTRSVSWTDGVLLFSDNSKVSVAADSITVDTGLWNTSNPNYFYIFYYDRDASTFKFLASSSTTIVNYPIFYSHFRNNELCLYPHYPIKRISVNQEYNTFLHGAEHLPKISHLAVLGDSLSSGGTWTRYLDDHIYIPQIDVYAKSGAAMANLISGTEDISVGQVNHVTEDVDTTIIFAGTNDGMLGGTVDEMKENPVGTSTSFTECYQYTIEKLLNINPKMKIFLITPMFTLGKTYGDKSITYDSNKQMRDAVIKVGQYYSLPVLDLFYNSGVNKINSTIYQTDGVHGTEAGYKNICEKIFRFLISNY